MSPDIFDGQLIAQSLKFRALYDCALNLYILPKSKLYHFTSSDGTIFCTLYLLELVPICWNLPELAVHFPHSHRERQQMLSVSCYWDVSRTYKTWLWPSGLCSEYSQVDRLNREWSSGLPGRWAWSTSDSQILLIGISNFFHRLISFHFC